MNLAFLWPFTKVWYISETPCITAHHPAIFSGTSVKHARTMLQTVETCCMYTNVQNRFLSVSVILMADISGRRTEYKEWEWSRSASSPEWLQNCSKILIALTAPDPIADHPPDDLIVVEESFFAIEQVWAANELACLLYEEKDLFLYGKMLGFMTWWTYWRMGNDKSNELLTTAVHYRISIAAGL